MHFSVRQSSARNAMSAADTEVLQHALRQRGLQAYATRFEQAALPPQMLHSLTNRELRDDLHVAPLSHRRAILAVLSDLRAPPALPDFGRVLVHLSNVRTFHSWLRLAFQAAIFSLALVRLHPLRGASLLRGAALSVAAAGAVCALFGGCRYFAVVARVDSVRRFEPDRVGVALAALAALAIAALVLTVVLVHGRA
ncbi:unnamed protein product [Agarophyton chilense]